MKIMLFSVQLQKDRLVNIYKYFVYVALLEEEKVKDKIHKRLEGPWGKLEGTC